MLSDGPVGKTCLVEQFVRNCFMDEHATIVEEVFEKQVFIDNKPVSLVITDTSGMPEYSASRDAYMRANDGFVLVYSITDHQTFCNLHKRKEQIDRVKNYDTKNMPLVLVGNKCDQYDKREVSIYQGERLARKLRCSFFEASAKVYRNVDEVFMNLAHQFSPKDQIPKDQNSASEY